MPQDEYSGTIPPIAEKEKRGHKIQTRLDPAYVLELVSKGKITQQLAAQLPNESVENYILKTFPHGSLNIPAFN